MGILVSFLLFFNPLKPFSPSPRQVGRDKPVHASSDSPSSEAAKHARPDDAEESEPQAQNPTDMPPGAPPPPMPPPTSNPPAGLHPTAGHGQQQQRAGPPYAGHVSQSTRPRTAEPEFEPESEDALHRMTISKLSNILQDTQPPQTQASPSPSLSSSPPLNTTDRHPLPLSSSTTATPTLSPTAHIQIPSPASQSSPPPSALRSPPGPASKEQQQQVEQQQYKVDAESLEPPPSPGGRQYLPVASDFTLRLPPSKLASPPPHEGPDPSTMAPAVAMSDVRPSSSYPQSPATSSAAYPSASSPPSSSTSAATPALPPLRIDVAAANDRAMDHEIEMADASFVGMGAGSMGVDTVQAGESMSAIPEGNEALMFDEEGLSSLEKIYLFARSEAPFHRVFIARSLINFLPEVDPAEAVDYVIPLMNGLAMDDDETVKEALVEDLVECIWWFLSVCHLVDYEIPDSAQSAGPFEDESGGGFGFGMGEDRARTQSSEGRPLLHVQAFTPLLGTLLLNPSAPVNAAARLCVVKLLTRLRDTELIEEQQQQLSGARPSAPSSSSGGAHFGRDRRKLFERELLHQVVIGMAHLQEDNKPTSEQHSRAPSGSGADPPRIFSAHAQGPLAPPEQSQSQPLPLGLWLDQQQPWGEAGCPPPLSAAEDKALLSTLTGSVLALATQQFLAQQEPLSSSSTSPPATGAEIARPPSPIPNNDRTFALGLLQAGAQGVGVSKNDVKNDEVVMHDVDTDIGRAPGPLSAHTTLQGSESFPGTVGNNNMRISPPLRSASSQEDHRMQISDAPLQTPYPEKFLSEPPMAIDQEEDADLEQEEERVEQFQFSDEQAAVGKLASMSLMAAVTANAPVDPECHGPFVQEVESAGRDPTYWVRREATFALGALAKVVPEELFYLSLVPLFNDLCEDPVPCVRQSVLFSLPAVLSRMPFDRRRTQALNTIQRMSSDPEKEVRTAALEVLGETIYSFHEDPRGPPEELVRLFIGEEGVDWHDPDSPDFEAYLKSKAQYPFSSYSARPPPPNTFSLLLPQAAASAASTPTTTTAETASDPTRALICAFNLPAVALVLGRAGWPQLRRLYVFLARTGTAKVHATLAASLGELARIVGPEHARRDLLYRFWDFVRGREAGARMKALGALPVLVRALAPPERARLVGDIEEDWEGHLKGWRERERLVQEIGGFLDLFPEDGETLRGLVRRALRDPTAAVRNAGIVAFRDIYSFLVSQSRPEVLNALKEDVTSLAYDAKYKFRITYVACMKGLLESGRPYDQFLDDIFWHAAVSLSSDPIVDVRIGTARLLSLACDAMLTRKQTLPGGVLNVIRTLSDDSSADVRAYVAHILSPEAQLLRGQRGFHAGADEDEGQRQAREKAATFSMPPKRRERMMVSRFEQMKISEDPRAMPIDSNRRPG